MKKTDIAMIILIASLSVMVAFMIANSIPFLKSPDKNVKVPTAQVIGSDVVAPSEKVFNERALNPTVETVIGGGVPTQ